MNIKGPKVINFNDRFSSGSLFKSSQHFTMIFNVLVLMNLFNGINCRRTDDDKTNFCRILAYPRFCGIWIISFFAQVALINFGSSIVSCVPLTLEQWVLCLVFGAAILLWHQVKTNSI